MLMINGLVQEGEIAAMRYTEETLESWISPLSQTEEQRVVNTIKMINNAVTSYDRLSDCTMEIFAQGSYAKGILPAFLEPLTSLQNDFFVSNLQLPAADIAAITATTT